MPKRFAALAVTFLFLLSIAPPAGAEQKIRMPTARDAQTIIANLEGFLNKRVERVLPGPVTDEEVVTIRSDPDGEPLTVRVDQRLMLRGLGDYFFRVPGPATQVVALPDSESQPGIRRGSILWQGFSPRRKLLASRATLVPEEELARLPLKVTVAITVDGEPIKADEPMSGSVRARIAIANVTTIPVNLATANVDRRPLVEALDAVNAVLERGERPVPGEAGVPKILVSATKTDFALDQIQTAFDVDLDLSWPNVFALRSSIGHADGSSIRLNEVIGGGGPARIVMRVRGRAQDARLPELQVVATPAAPPASTVDPPGASTWADVPESRVSNADMFKVLMQTMWRTALLVNFDAYLGNPDAKGVSSTTYRYVLATPDEVVSFPAPPTVPKADPVTVVLAFVALALLLAAMGATWALA